MKYLIAILLFASSIAHAELPATKYDGMYFSFEQAQHCNEENLQLAAMLQAVDSGVDPGELIRAMERENNPVIDLDLLRGEFDEARHDKWISKAPRAAQLNVYYTLCMVKEHQKQ